MGTSSKATTEKRQREERITAEWAEMIRACRGCIYHAAGKYCDYIGIMGHKRPCPPGKLCTVKEMVGGSRPRRSPVNYEKVRELYDQGMTDREIAEGAHCGQSTVSKWRKQNGLPANAAKKP